MATASERIREAKIETLARELLKELTNRSGWNEDPTIHLVNALADYLDPPAEQSIASLIEGRGKS